jgi:hypothetical protein
MLTLVEFCERYRISLKKAKRMHKEGALRVADAPSDVGAKIFATLAARNPLSAYELCALVDDPGLILTLGRYADRASEQLETVGAAGSERAPKAIAALLTDAADGDVPSVEALGDWLRSILPVEPVPYAWIASRLLLAMPDNIRQFEGARIQRALNRVRKLESFAGWFAYELRAGRKVTLYARPKTLALLDL